MLKCKHQCHCTCSSQIWTCIINDAWRPAPHRKQRKYTGFFWSNLAKRRFVRMFWRSILTFNARKKQTFKKNINKLTGDSAYKNIATLLRLKAEMLGKKVIKWYLDMWFFFNKPSLPKSYDPPFYLLILHLFSSKIWQLKNDQIRKIPVVAI